LIFGWRFVYGGMAERRGKGLQIPLHGFKSRFHLKVEIEQMAEIVRVCTIHNSQRGEQ
ncbi:MAG: hypothetical protein RLZZ73_419, partial [Actinomycetota bacterium]